MLESNCIAYYIPSPFLFLFFRLKDAKETRNEETNHVSFFFSPKNSNLVSPFYLILSIVSFLLKTFPLCHVCTLNEKRRTSSVCLMCNLSCHVTHEPESRVWLFIHRRNKEGWNITEMFYLNSRKIPRC